MYIGNAKGSNGVINYGLSSLDEQYAQMRKYPRGLNDLTLNNVMDLIASIEKTDTSESLLTFDGGVDLSGTNKWVGGVLAPNGKIYGIPRDSTSVLCIDPSDNSITTFGSLSGTDKWLGGVLAPNGKIYGIPYNSTTILCIDPSDNSITTFGSLSGIEKWYGGVLAPNGKIYGIPHNSTSILCIDPSDNSVTTFGSLIGTVKWLGGVLAPNGKIYGIPRDSTSILEISGIGSMSSAKNALTHPFINKL